jgi:HK97 family phage portal protein
MGFFRDLIGVSPKTDITAQLAPPVVTDAFNFYSQFSPFQTVSRNEAISVPSVMRCRNLIATTIGVMNLETYSKATKEELPNLPWVNQLSKSAPNSVIITALVDALFFYGVGYLEVTEVYQDDNRPARFDFVNNIRVTVQLNKNNTFVDFYSVDGVERPMSGVGSLITVQSPIDGILISGARTLRAAIDLEKAVSVASSTPQPAGILKNNGADMGEKEVAGLLAAWRSARANRSTAYLTASLEYQPTSFSPKDMLYVDGLQNMATQIARLCNVPAYYISADTGNNSMTYANVQDERRQFVALSLQPYISAIESRFSMDDLTPNTQFVAFDMDSGFLRANPLERLAVIEKMLALNLITVEQAREMEELSPNGNN